MDTLLSLESGQDPEFNVWQAADTSSKEKARIKRRIARRRDGAAAGFMAGAFIIVWFFLMDVVVFEPLTTPRFLADSVLGQLKQLGGFIEFLRVWLFSCVHLAIFAWLGIVVEVVFRRGRIEPRIIYGMICGLVIFTPMFFFALGLTGARLTDKPGWWAVPIANMLAGAVLVWYLRWRDKRDQEEKVTRRSVGLP